jgi:hypothetical protein
MLDVIIYYAVDRLLTLLVEVSHADFTEVTRMVLVHVGSVVVLTTSETTTTGVLSFKIISIRGVHHIN